MKLAVSVVVGCAGAVLLAFGAFFALRDETHHGARRSASPSSTVVAPAVEPAAAARPLPPARAPAAAVAASAPAANDGLHLDEAALMDTLRELRGSDSNLTLQLAREGNRRFKPSADTAERSWFIVKALSDLGRHDEARVEGRALVDGFRETRWAQDVYRHLFVNPPTHPFERGYGKTLESDP